MLANRQVRRGFTLIEVMIVVVLLGILSTVAYVTYRRFVAASYKHEATSVISGIAAAQESFRAETGVYLNVSSSATSYYPAANPGPFKSEWGGPCATCSASWTRLAYKPSGPVIFGYSTTAGVASTTVGNPGGPGGPGGGGVNYTGYGGQGHGESDGIAPIGGGETTVPPAAMGTTGPFYMVNAAADTDGNGVYTTAMLYSQSRNIVFMNEGE